MLKYVFNFASYLCFETSSILGNLLIKSKKLPVVAWKKAISEIFDTFSPYIPKQHFIQLQLLIYVSDNFVMG